MANKLVIFEDDAALLNAYRLKLSADKNWQVVVFSDGEGALAKVKAEKPDLIILDLLMPKRSGVDILKDLKADAEVKDIPVIVASNFSQKVTIEDIFKLGAVDYFVKSDATIGEILEKAKRHITLTKKSKK